MLVAAAAAVGKMRLTRPDKQLAGLQVASGRVTKMVFSLLYLLIPFLPKLHSQPASHPSGRPAIYVGLHSHTGTHNDRYPCKLYQRGSEDDDNVATNADIGSAFYLLLSSPTSSSRLCNHSTGCILSCFRWCLSPCI